MLQTRFYQSRLKDDSSHLAKDKGDAGQKNEPDQGLVKNRFRQFAEAQESRLRSDDRDGNRQQGEPENVGAHAVLPNHQCRHNDVDQQTQGLDNGALSAFGPVMQDALHYWQGARQPGDGP